MQTGGYDTHAGQNPNAGQRRVHGPDGTLNDGLFAFYNDLQNQGLLGDTLVLQFSEFGRRITENGSQGTDHGAAGVMMAIGGAVRGGIYGTAPNLRIDARQPDAREQRRRRALRDRLPSVYAQVIDSWLGADSVAILGGDFRAGAPAFL